jgi:hypothetical protein
VHGVSGPEDRKPITLLWADRLDQDAEQNHGCARRPAAMARSRHYDLRAEVRTGQLGL